MMDGHLDTARVAAQARTQHLEGALLGRPHQVGRDLPSVVVRLGGDVLPLTFGEKVPEKGGAAVLDDLEIAANRPGRADHADGPAGPVADRDFEVARYGIDENERLARRRIAHLDAGQRGALRRQAGDRGDRGFGGQSAQ
jgi:hypothetical protein